MAITFLHQLKSVAPRNFPLAAIDMLWYAQGVRQRHDMGAHAAFGVGNTVATRMVRKHGGSCSLKPGAGGI